MIRGQVFPLFAVWWELGFQCESRDIALARATLYLEQSDNYPPSSAVGARYIHVLYLIEQSLVDRAYLGR